MISHGRVVLDQEKSGKVISGQGISKCQFKVSEKSGILPSGYCRVLLGLFSVDMAILFFEVSSNHLYCGWFTARIIFLHGR